jgi:Tol biopolymer transport system component
MTVRRAAVLVATAGLVIISLAGGASAQPVSSNGAIVFERLDPVVGDDTDTFVVNPDGTGERRLYAGTGEAAQWSPDGRQVAILTPCPDGSGDCAAVLVDVASGAFRAVRMPDPTLWTGCTVWSPDGAHLACSGSSDVDPSRNGIYTIRVADGLDLKRMTNGNDGPGEYSPDGNRLVFGRSVEGDQVAGLWVVRLTGGQPRRITPDGAILQPEDTGTWSPQGNRILFAMRTAADHRYSIWVVDADGGNLRQVPIQPACGGAFSDPDSVGCFGPSWSPDGARIVFSRVVPGEGTTLYTVNVDGTDLRKVTTGDGLHADWGPSSVQVAR